MKKIWLISGLLVLLLGSISTVAAQSGGYDLSWRVIGSGGGASTGGVYALSGTVGQAVVERSGGGRYALASGFWVDRGSSTPDYDHFVYLPVVLR
ncbi:MAG: hypothetical protein JXR84_24405 [Anaerolineae bacterium]|nr:hypothetical protein [Anaerolineae bacterium]